MAPVNGRPFLEHLILGLARQGIVEIVLCVGHLGERISAHFGDGAGFGVTIRYAVEEELLGTGGAVGNARPHLDGDFLLLNGDTFLGLDVGRLVEAHRGRSRDPLYCGTLAVVSSPDRARYGSVSADASGRIAGFREKSRDGGEGWINAGVAAFAPEIFRFIPPGRPSSLESEVIPQAIAAGRTFYAFPVKGPFVDIGTPEGHARAGGILSP